MEARPRGGGYAGLMAWGPEEGGEEPKPHISTQTGSPGFRFCVSLFLAGCLNFSKPQFPHLPDGTMETALAS